MQTQGGCATKLRGRERGCKDKTLEASALPSKFYRVHNRLQDYVEKSTFSPALVFWPFCATSRSIKAGKRGSPKDQIRNPSIETCNLLCTQFHHLFSGVSLRMAITFRKNKYSVTTLVRGASRDKPQRWYTG